MDLCGASNSKSWKVLMPIQFGVENVAFHSSEDITTLSMFSNLLNMFVLARLGVFVSFILS